MTVTAKLKVTVAALKEILKEEEDQVQREITLRESKMASDEDANVYQHTGEEMTDIAWEALEEIGEKV